MKTVYKQTTEQVDRTTGEILTTSRSSVISKGSEPAFIKMYLNDLVLLNSSTNKTTQVLYQLIKLVNYDGQFVINAGIKRKIATDLSINAHSISNTLTKFVKDGIIQRIDTGIYLLNPALFAKGAWKDVSNLRDNFITMTIEYSDSGRNITTKVGE